MKLKIKVKEITEGCMPVINPNGDWIDLNSSEDHALRKNEFKLLRLGVAMELPKGFEAHVLPRSSTYKNFKLICSNSQGIIDNSYNGDGDEWRFPVIALDDVTIAKHYRICQFRVVLSQKATIWQKIKWLFYSGIKLVKVDNLNNKNRDGFGSTGIK